MKTLVIGGTGTVGSEVVRQLLARGEKVRVMSTSADKIKTLPAGAEGVVADLRTPISLPAALAGVDGMFMATALSQDETQQGLAAVAAAKTAGIGRFVYMSVHNAAGAAHIPHFGSKLPIEKALAESGLGFTILSPNNFFQNDLWFRDVILQYGIYPQPMGNAGTSRVDVRDIAAAAVNSLIEDGHNSQNYVLVGPDVLTGEGTAAILSRHLGKQIRYGGDDLDAWSAQAQQMMPDWMVHDLRIMYQHFQKHGLIATAADLALQQKVLGRPPRRYEAFVEEIAPAWKGQAAVR
jgi:uncharacterized protein YbjT (DUF2867 family)